jgi:pimeloyl-ACP methyl ester carboxylesterase
MDRLRSTSAASALPHDEAGSGPAIVLLHAGIADRSMWAEQLEPLAATLPRAQHAVIAGAGHLAPLETPAVFRELLLGFLG